MIVRTKPSVWQLFTIYRLSVLPQVAWQLLSVCVFSALIVALQDWRPGLWRTWSVAPFTLLGVALSIFLGFRNNACYDRWWEARRQLGALIGEMRSFARLAGSLPTKKPERRLYMVRLAIAFTYALMAHLRGWDMPAEVLFYSPGEPTLATARNVPDALLRRIAVDITAMLAEGEIGEQIFRVFDDRLTAFASIQVACERIRATPTPFPYTLLLHRTAYAYCFLLPFGMASSMHWGTPLFCALVAYAFFGLDALGDELEEPFGRSLNALPLSAMARTVEISLLEALGESPLPQPLEPVDAVLF